jgi:hypothetical protein
MKPLVIRFQEDLTTGSKKITDQLRTAKLISAKLELAVVQDWIGHELDGYPIDSAKLPKYRFISGGQLQFYNPAHGWIPAMAQAFTNIPIYRPIAELESYNKGDLLYFMPAKKIRLTDLIGDSGLITSFPQRIEFSISAAIGILEAVRNRLLEWSIELERQGILGENMSFKDEEKAIAKNQTFNIEHMTGFIGDVSQSKVEVYDYSSIHKTLKDAGVPKAERDSLEEIMDKLKVSAPEEKPRLLEKGKAWVTKNQEFLGAATSIVVKALQAST